MIPVPEADNLLQQAWAARMRADFSQASQLEQKARGVLAQAGLGGHDREVYIMEHKEQSERSPLNLRQAVLKLAHSKPELRRFLVPILRSKTAQEEEEDEEESKSTSQKKKVPPKWEEFLKAKYEGGKKKVPNPNPKTKQKYPTVSISTALRDKDVMKKVMEEYHKWVKGTDDEKTKGKKTKKPERVKPKGTTKSPIKDPKVRKKIEQYSKEMKKTVKNAIREFKKEKPAGVSLKDLEPSTGDSCGWDDCNKWSLKTYRALPKEQQKLFTAGHLIGAHFEDYLKETHPDVYKTHRNYMNWWREGTDNDYAAKMQGLLSNLGVTGFPAPKDEDDARYNLYFQEGGQDKKTKEWFTVQYAYIQTVFEQLGIKELTLFRGVRDDKVTSVPPKDGDPVEIKCREASSFSGNPYVAGTFGRPIEFKVPVEQVFASSLTRPEIGSTRAGEGSWGEDEYVLLGASNLTGVTRLS